MCVLWIILRTSHNKLNLSVGYKLLYTKYILVSFLGLFEFMCILFIYSVRLYYYEFICDKITIIILIIILLN